MAAWREDYEAKGIVPTDIEIRFDSLNRQYFEYHFPWASALETSSPKMQLTRLLRKENLLSSSLTEDHCRRVLDLLIKHPDLAKTKVKPGLDSGYPLFHMAAAYGVSLEIIQGIYSLNKEAIREPADISKSLPLHWACQYSASEDVIKFLLAQYPQAASVQTFLGGCLPIHHAVQKTKTSTATLDALIEAFPECTHVKNHLGNTLFDEAFNFSCNPSMLEHLLGQIPIKHLNVALVMQPDVFRVDLSLLKTCLDIAMPHVQQMSCQLFRDEGWERSIELLESMKHSQLRSVEIGLIGALPFTSQKVFSHTRDFFEQNPTLQEVSLALFPGRKERAPYDLPGADKFCHAILEACAMVQTLVLECFSFLDSGASLANMLRSGSLDSASKLKELKLHLVRVDRPYNEPGQCDWKMKGAWRDCKLEKLSLINCHLTDQTLSTFLEEMPHMPLLRDLVLSFRSAVPDEYDHDEDTEPIFDDIESLDITEPIVQILNQGRLRALAVEGPRVNISGICHALTEQTGAGLVKYHVPSSLRGETNMSCLANHMTTNDWPLADILFPEEENGEMSDALKKHRADIEYFSSINYFGRSILAEGSVKRDVALLIQKLETIEDIETSDKSPASVPVLYSLLRRAPSSWSTL